MAPPAPLSARALGRATLARQGLLSPIRSAPAAAVERLGSLQAQHPEWPPVALAVRAASRRTADLAGALARREVVRSSLMRITIHVVTADDLWPMFALCQPMRLEQWRLIAKAHPSTSALGRRMTAAHAAAISALAERPRSSLELDRIMFAEVGEVKSPIPRLAWRHFSAHVPLVHIPHDREGYGRSLYAVATDWLGLATVPPWDLDRSREHVARRYLGAFGPASIADLAAYVGGGRGGITAWRRALEALADELVELRDNAGRTLFDLADAPRPSEDTDAPPRLLARWDSVLLSHAPRERGRILDDAARAAVFTKNADVRPSFLVDGMVAGTWDLTRRDGAATVELRPIRRLSRAVSEALEGEAARVLGLVAPDAPERSVALSHPPA
jgi:Winged helix DNA-binding domain